MAQRFANVLSPMDDELCGIFSNPADCVYELLAYFKDLLGAFGLIFHEWM